MSIKEAKKLFRSITNISDDIIESAQTVSARERRKMGSRVKWGAAAACLCLAAVSAFLIERFRVPQQTDFTAPEAIVIPELWADGMGFEGYMCYDISELDNGNPWSENMDITALPVYKNRAYDASGAGIPIGLSEEEMTERLKIAVDALNLEVLSTEVITDGFPENYSDTAAETGPAELRAATDNGALHVLADGRISYFLPDEGLALPDEYHFTYYDTTEEEAEHVLSYLIASYRELLDSELLAFEDPRAVTSGDYNIYGAFNRSYYVYDASGDALEDILNFNFRYVGFLPSHTETLWGIQITDGLLLAEKLGDYPIITVEEAKERLIAGNYQTTVPAAFSGEEYIGKVELVYRTGRLEEILLPYYRFYVLLTDAGSETADENGLKTYGAYYVPAIADKYIVNLPVYDGASR